MQCNAMHKQTNEQTNINQSYYTYITHNSQENEEKKAENNEKKKKKKKKKLKEDEDEGNKRRDDARAGDWIGLISLYYSIRLPTVLSTFHFPLSTQSVMSCHVTDGWAWMGLTYLPSLLSSLRLL